MRRFCRCLVLFIVLSSWLSIASAQVVNMPDANLRAAVRDVLGLGLNAPITRQAMQGLTSLDAQLSRIREITGQEGEISNIKGLEHATQLTQLWLNFHQIQDIAPLAGLIQLEDLDITGNPITNFQPLAKLRQLRTLSVSVERISDLHQHIVDLTRLKSLEFTGGPLPDLHLLNTLPHLESLGLNFDAVNDLNLQSLVGLIQLKSLTIWESQVHDVSPLAKMTHLEGLYLAALRISDIRPLAGLTQLKSLSLWMNEVSNIRPLAGLKNLEFLELTGNQISDVSPLAGLVNLETLWLQGNPIQDTSPLSNLPRLDHVDINIPRSPAISIPDPKLAAAVRKALGLGSNVPITKQKIQGLTWLDARESQIKNLTGLEHATKLEFLELRKNQITDIRPLANLKNLKELILEINDVRNIRPLANLTQLTLLYIAANPISDFTPLANLTELRSLALSDNNISDVTLIADKVQLIHLYLWDNNISDIRPLANLTQLQVLHLQGNAIRDIRPLANLTKLTDLRLKGNPIQDTSMLTSLTKLRDVDIDIHQQSVPATGTWLAVEQPPGLSAANLVIKPGTFAIFVHKNQPSVSQSADFNTYRLRSVLGAADFPNLADFFQNGGRIELVSYPSGNPLPPNTREPQFADVVISEIMWGLDSSYPRKQYIELYNMSPHTYTFANGDLMFRFSNASEKPLPSGIFTPPFNTNTRLKVIDKVGNKGWKVPGKSGNMAENKPLISMYRTIDYTTGDTPDGTLASNWKESIGRVNLPAPSYGTPGAKHLPPAPVVSVGRGNRPPLYWIDTQRGTLHRLIGDKVENLLPGVQNAISLAVANNKMYWTEDTGGNIGTVKRANLDGSNMRILTTLQSVPTSIAVDAVNSKLYWTNSRGRIQAMNFNGGAITNLIQNLKEPNNITLHTAGSKLYWGEPDSIWRADLNGNNREEFAPNLGELRSIAIAGSRIYSIERPEGEQHWQIRSSTLDGLTPTKTLAMLQSKPLGLAVDTTGGKLYWTNADGKIQRTNLSGGNIQDVVTGLSAPGDIVLDIPTRTNPAAPVNTALVTHQLPAETRLLANYPNPFNPETWIPYQLATDTDVQILIYDARGSIVRRLGLGHQLTGTYTDRSQAAYWDGRNTLGEPVASGLYFYQLQTDTVSLLRRMLILR